MLTHEEEIVADLKSALAEQMAAQNFTGSVTITINYHKGVGGKAALGVTKTIA